jgi:hypothetical protein
LRFLGALASLRWVLISSQEFQAVGRFPSCKPRDTSINVHRKGAKTQRFREGKALSLRFLRALASLRWVLISSQGFQAVGRFPSCKPRDTSINVHRKGAKTQRFREGKALSLRFLGALASLRWVLISSQGFQAVGRFPSCKPRDTSINVHRKGAKTQRFREGKALSLRFLGALASLRWVLISSQSFSRSASGRGPIRARGQLAGRSAPSRLRRRRAGSRG